MALPSSGQLSLNQLHVEAGGTTGTQASMNDSDIRGLIDKGNQAQNKISEYYGASSTPAFSQDYSTQVGTSTNAAYYLKEPANTTNLYLFNVTSPTVDLRYGIVYGSPPTYSTFGYNVSSNGAPPTPAIVADSDGHRHDHVGYICDGGDGYAPASNWFYFEADSGGRMLGDGTAGDWGDMEVYSNLADYAEGQENGNGPAYAPNGSLGNNQGYVDILAHSYATGNANAITNTFDDIPYGVNSNVSMFLSPLTGFLFNTQWFHWDIE